MSKTVSKCDFCYLLDFIQRVRWSRRSVKRKTKAVNNAFIQQMWSQLLKNCRSADDLHTHLLSSSSTRSPRQVQLTLPLGVSRQRSPQPPFMFRQGDSSPSMTVTQMWLDGQLKQLKSNKKGQMHSWGTSDIPSLEPLFSEVLWLHVMTYWTGMQLSQLLTHITHTTSAIKWSGVAFLTIWRTDY